MAANDILALAEGKAALNIQNTDVDAEIPAYITEASMFIDDICGPVVIRAVSETFLHPAGSLFLKVPPGSPTFTLASMVVTEYVSGTATILTAEDFDTAGTYRFEPTLGSIRRRSSWNDTWWASQEVIVTYTGGRFANTAAVSEKFKGACRKVLVHLWQTRGSQSGFGTPGGDGAPFGGVPYSPETLMKHLRVMLKNELLMDSAGLAIAQMATSQTVSAVKTALVSGMTTAINDTNVQVAYGRPQDSLVRRESVFVADVDYSARVANIRSGRKQYDEDYTIDVVFAVAKPKGTSSDAEARVFALFEFLRDWLADNASGASVDGVWSLTLESVDVTTTHQGEGPVTVLVATVRVKARVE